MEDRKTIFDYLGQILIVFAVTIISTAVFAKVAGDITKDISKMYQLGSRGLALETIVQFLGTSVIIIILKYFFMESRIALRIGLLIRVGLMLVSIVIMIAVFIWRFEWFPINAWEPWISFFIMFLLYFLASSGIMWLKANLENKKLDQALKKYREEVMGDEQGNDRVK